MQVGDTPQRQDLCLTCGHCWPAAATLHPKAWASLGGIVSKRSSGVVDAPVGRAELLYATRKGSKRAPAATVRRDRGKCWGSAQVDSPPWITRRIGTAGLGRPWEVERLSRSRIARAAP